MRRWLQIVLALALTAAVAIAIGRFQRKRVQEMRWIAYEANLHSYATALPLGIPREQLENYLQSKGVDFDRVCCTDQTDAYADITKIGQEEAPWYCSRLNIYIAFQFVGSESATAVSHARVDTLKSVSIFKRLEDCL